MSNARKVALSDIAKYLEGDKTLRQAEWNGCGYDVYTVGVGHLIELTSRQQAKELGLLSTNKGRHNMARCRKKK